MKTEKKRPSLKFDPIFCPNLGEDQKEKKKVFTEIWSDCLPKIRWRPDQKDLPRESKFFRASWVRAQVRCTPWTPSHRPWTKDTMFRDRIFSAWFQAISKKGHLATKSDLQLVSFLFNESTNSSILEPATEYVRRLVGFEAKAKNFKMCPRGQKCLRGLYSTSEYNQL